ncbi:LuxR family transcriptional regulator [Actinoplanes sp. N902-109]|nr:LuxR family transcriptional regulator [Actinoplanes sp. N902-109]
MDGVRDAPGLIGRGSVWATLTGLLDPAVPTGALLLTGPAGIGKTSLVERFTAGAAELGHPVLHATGDGQDRPYALLRALLGSTAPDGLPEAQSRALRSALTHGEPADLLALRLSVCSAVGALAGDRPVALIVDDVDRADAASFDLLLTLASVLSWGQLPVVALFACRTERVPVELAELIAPVVVPPLTELESQRLLDLLPTAPAGSARLEVLRRAAGNPLALHEYAAGSDTPAGVSEVFARRVRGLPAGTLRALTLAAAGERDLAALPGTPLRDWQPAEDAGLIRITDATVHFRHPLVEYAVLRTAGPQAARAAHRTLAGAATDPLRRLRHRAAAADSPDPELAGALVDAARQLDGAGVVTAVTLLEHAHDLVTPDRRSEVLLEAAERAAAVGRVRWAGELLDRAAAGYDRAAEPALDIRMTALSAWTRTMRGWVHEAAELLAGRISPRSSANHLVGTAGLPVFLLGDGPLHAAVRAATAATPLLPINLFSLAAVRPDERVREAVLAQPGATPGDPQDLVRAAGAGAAAVLIDEPEHATTLLAPAVQAVSEGRAAGVFLTAPGAAGWALVDAGRWVEAERWMVPLLSSPVAAEATLVRFGTDVQLAVVAYGRGREGAARELLARTDRWTGVPLFVLRTAWARGVAALARGDHEQARHDLATAVAVPHDARVLALPDLVAAELAAGRPAPVAAVAELRSWYDGRWLPARRRLRLAAAEALLAGDPAGVADALGPLVAAPQARRWPFERAVLAVELAARQRRAQQPRPARDTLLDALDTFERLGAAAWAARVKAELRIGTPEADPLGGLSAQQEQIVRLAAAGLSNREIGERLFLSPRTIGSHLYRIFPQLGVRNRTQLGELLAGPGRKPPGHRDG